MLRGLVSDSELAEPVSPRENRGSELHENSRSGILQDLNRQNYEWWRGGVQRLFNGLAGRTNEKSWPRSCDLGQLGLLQLSLDG